MGTLTLELNTDSGVTSSFGECAEYFACCNVFNDKRSMSTPLAFWTEQDILNYLIKYNIPIASVYGKIINANQRTSGHEPCRTGKTEQRTP